MKYRSIVNRLISRLKTWWGGEIVRFPAKEPVFELGGIESGLLELKLLSGKSIDDSMKQLNKAIGMVTEARGSVPHFEWKKRFVIDWFAVESKSELEYQQFVRMYIETIEFYVELCVSVNHTTYGQLYRSTLESDCSKFMDIRKFLLSRYVLK